MIPEAEFIPCILLLSNSFNGDEFQLSYMDRSLFSDPIRSWHKFGLNFFPGPIHSAVSQSSCTKIMLMITFIITKNFYQFLLECLSPKYKRNRENGVQGIQD